jgi:hypothetical protein
VCLFTVHWAVGLPPSPVHFPPTTAFTSFPAPDCWACLFTAYVGGGSSPLSCGFFLPLPLSHAFLLLVAGRTPPLPPSLDRPGLFTYSSGRDSPPPLFGAQGAPPSLQCVFIVLIAYYSVSLFSLGGGRSVQGAMLIWPRVVCGSTAYRLPHLVRVIPSPVISSNATV